jgi:hypothetical protein
MDPVIAVPVPPKVVILPTLARTEAEEKPCIFVHFLPQIPDLPENMTITLICTIERRKDVFTITTANQHNIIWKIYSDKYIDTTSFTYDMLIEVTGEKFRDEPVMYGTFQPLKVDLPKGRVKYIDPQVLLLPQPTDEQSVVINNYIMAARQNTVRTSTD